MAWTRIEERAQRRVEQARQGQPAWFDMERLPWWLFAMTGLLFLWLCVNNLLDADTTAQRTWAVFGLTTVVPAQFITAYRLRQGIPLTQPWLRRK